jgi:hypothetical protein
VIYKLMAEFAGTNDDLQISEIDSAVKGEGNATLRAEVAAFVEPDSEN